MNPAFTDQTKAVVEYSRQEALRLGHDYIGTEHLLLGILKDGQGAATQALTDLGINLGSLKHSIEVYFSTSGKRSKVNTDVPFSPRAKQILDIATEEAKIAAVRHVGVEHLLLSLLKDREGVAAQLLAAFGVSYEMALAELAVPGSGAHAKKVKETRLEQQAFVLYYRPLMDSSENVVEKTNLGTLNDLLSGGWTVSKTEGLAGGDQEGYFVSLLLLTRKA